MTGLDAHLQGWDPGEHTDVDPLPAERAAALAAVLATPERLTPGQSAAGQSAPGQSVPGQSAAGQSAAGQSAAGQSAAGQSAPGQSTPGGALPPLWHWVFFQEWPRHGELGRDGHPAEGHFLPPIPDRRRMFAGGRLTVHRALELDRPAERTRSLANVSVKTGRSGEMAFVTVRSVFDQGGRTCLTEEHDYVYRSGESTAKSPEAARPQQLPSSAAPWQEPFTGDPVRLFRYSALTANSHRIHYDAPYAREVESYPDLVVHGPLLVLLLSELGRANSVRRVSTVEYRLRRPVFAGDPVLLTGTPEEGEAGTAALNGDGAVMAEATLGLT